jgi:hypothetical protein
MDFNTADRGIGKSIPRFFFRYLVVWYHSFCPPDRTSAV